MYLTVVGAYWIRLVQTILLRPPGERGLTGASRTVVGGGGRSGTVTSTGVPGGLTTGQGATGVWVTVELAPTLFHWYSGEDWHLPHD